MVLLVIGGAGARLLRDADWQFGVEFGRGVVAEGAIGRTRIWMPFSMLFNVKLKLKESILKWRMKGVWKAIDHSKKQLSEKKSPGWKPETSLVFSLWGGFQGMSLVPVDS